MLPEGERGEDGNGLHGDLCGSGIVRVWALRIVCGTDRLPQVPRSSYIAARPTSTSKSGVGPCRNRKIAVVGVHIESNLCPAHQSLEAGRPGRIKRE